MSRRYKSTKTHIPFSGHTSAHGWFGRNPVSGTGWTTKKGRKKRYGAISSRKTGTYSRAKKR